MIIITIDNDIDLFKELIKDDIKITNPIKENLETTYINYLKEKYEL